MKRVLGYITFLIVIGAAIGCKKDRLPEEENNWSIADESYLKDSTLFYTKLLSLWQDYIIPRNIGDIQDSTVLRSLTQKYETAEDVLDYLVSLTPNDPNSNKPIDRYSFIDREGTISREIQDAVSTSYGMSVFYLQTQEAYNDNNNAYLYVRMVDANSPAYAAGIRRGDRILSINGKTNFDWNTQNPLKFKDLYAALATIEMTVKWRTPNSVDIEKKIISSSYAFDPILSNKVFDISGKKIGYLAFSSFVNIINKDTYTKMYSDFENIFNSFESNGVSSLIVDLRYNGGGSVNTAEYLADKIAPSTADKKLMYTYKVNKILGDQWKWTAVDSAFGPVNFKKKGNLNLNTVYFLVTNSTASASELLINSLKPYMNVQVIGSEKTYGKPVGFFGIPIERGKSKLEIYVTSFQMFNASGFGDYFGGLDLNKTTREDFLKDFGDPLEGFIAEALYHAKNGSYSIATKSAIASKDRIRNENSRNIMNVNTKASDLGMFKFKDELRRLR